MKLARVSFEHNVLIPLGRDIGGGSRQDLRDASFDVVDGWTIELLDGAVRITREGMPSPAWISGYGMTYTELSETFEEMTGPKARRKR